MNYRVRSRTRRAALTTAIVLIAGSVPSCRRDKDKPRQNSTPVSIAAQGGPLERASIERAPSSREVEHTKRSSQEQQLLASVGRRIFFDPRLSEPPGTSCATCHDPASGFAGNNGSVRGVARGSRPGHFAARNTPSVQYLSFVPPFHFRWEEDAPLPDAVGGFWDGRSDSLAALARQPLFNPDEMNAGTPDAVARKLSTSPYIDDLRSLFGSQVDNPEGAVNALGSAIEAFLKSKEMRPFSSKYDEFVRGRTALTETESRGLTTFKDPAKGNCATCHRLNEATGKPERSLFTDYSFDVVAVPRNRDLSEEREPQVDLGLCVRPSAQAQSKDDRFCGAFRTPSLRNVALRSSFMHNGAFRRLRDVVAFYATRGTDPKRWYPAAPYDDLPAKYVANVNVDTPPYDGRARAKPRLDDAEIDAIVAFLHTLTDTPTK